MSENLSKLALKEPVQFIPASNVSEEKKHAKCPPFCSERGHICPTDQSKKCVTILPNLSSDFITKIHCLLRWVTGAAVQHMPKQHSAVLLVQEVRDSPSLGS